MNDYNKFRAKTLKLRSKKHFKVTHSHGNKDAWRWLKKNKWLDLGQPVTERDFGLIVKTINRYLVEKLLSGYDIVFPCRMGRVELRKYFSRIWYEGDKLRTNLPIDWKRTLQLWNSDKEAQDRKFLVRQEEQALFKIIYSKKSANFNNKTFYQFGAARGVKKALKDKIKNKEIDAFLIGEYELR